MADYGFRVAKDGQDVRTAADKDLVYSSKYNGMKIKTHNTKATTGNVAHGLDYVPTFLNFRETSGQYRLDTSEGFSSADLPYATSSNIVFGRTNNYYFIFINRG